MCYTQSCFVLPFHGKAFAWYTPTLVLGYYMTQGKHGDLLPEERSILSADFYLRHSSRSLSILSTLLQKKQEALQKSTLRSVLQGDLECNIDLPDYLRIDLEKVNLWPLYLTNKSVWKQSYCFSRIISIVGRGYCDLHTFSPILSEYKPWLCEHFWSTAIIPRLRTWWFAGLRAFKRP